MSIFRIHGAFDEAGAASVSLIDLNNINPLEYTLNLVSYDTNGDYLKYFIHLDNTYASIFNPVESFLSGLNLTGSNLYFNGSSTYRFVVVSRLPLLKNY